MHFFKQCLAEMLSFKALLPPEDRLVNGRLDPFVFLEFVDAEMTEKERPMFLESLSRQAPFGDGVWQRKMCLKFGLESTIRSKGRPRRQEK
ncbi:hypothetical protein Dace_0826 [Desulfuromonas acetoxidans DSM 684]|uniref:Uncharacterized protein n=1 Tax=Desulfuromonas acetoxidans (strain DSM 684 / 11070) TaxID=281689 RepID=Q1JWY6_DESA6|nr:hypothetical protein Dace_0826 [Desulfuromonas acetoxidans DSM 684]